MGRLKGSKATCPDVDFNSKCNLNLVKTYSVGFLTLLCSIAFFVACVPVLIYRWCLVKFCSNYIPREDGIRTPVSPLGNIFAPELMTNKPPRCAIVATFVLENEKPVDHDEIKTRIQSRWIDAIETENHREELKYPELQQYVDFWMGFMFWKQDFNFDLSHHLKFQKIPETTRDVEDTTSQIYMHSLVEDLLNRPFPRGKSPWEIYIVENYNNSELASTKLVSKSMTAIVLRFHHSLADGYSLLYAVTEGLFGQSITEVDLAVPQESTLAQYIKPHSSLALGSLLLNMIHDVGSICLTCLNMKKTPWHVSDRKKKWKQLHAKSQLIPIQTLKDIKNAFGVSFTGTILSCISAGTQKSLKEKWDFEVDEILSGSPLPLPGHPKKLINHVTAAVFGLPTSSSLNCLERLVECEKRLHDARTSTLPLVGALYGYLVGSLLTPLAKGLLHNNMIPAGLTNFPGPGKTLNWNGMKGLTADFVAGAVTGVAGVGFMVLSYNGYLRIAVSAENAIMEQEDIDKLLNYVVEEISDLHSLSISKIKKSI